MYSIKRAYKEFTNSPEGGVAYNKFKEVLYSKEDSVVENVTARLRSNGWNDEINIIDIGAGDGKRTLAIIEHIRSGFSGAVNLDFVDQSKYFTDCFLKRQEINDINKLNVYNCDIEDVELSNKYDLILMIHSIFAFDSPKLTNDIYNSLKPGGQLIIVSNTTYSFLGQLKVILDLDYNNRRVEIDDIESYLDKLDVEFVKEKFLTCPRISKGNLNQSLSQIIKWLSLGKIKEASYLGRQASDTIFSFLKKDGNDFHITEEEVILDVKAPKVNQYSEVKCLTNTD